MICWKTQNTKFAEPIEEKKAVIHTALSSENESDSFPDSAVVYQFIGEFY